VGHRAAAVTGSGIDTSGFSIPLGKIAMAHRDRLGVLVAAILLLGGTTTGARAQSGMDTPLISTGASGSSKVTVTIQAGPSGAPGGFTLWWMKESDYLANGVQWFPNGDARQGQAFFWGNPSLNTHDGAYTTFALAPLQAIEVEIGDLQDESGVTVTLPAAAVPTGGELDPGTSYVFCAFANGTASLARSQPTATVRSVTRPWDCTRSRGYWKSHAARWPVSSVPMPLGSNSYGSAELLQILNQPAGGNGAVALAHQLIAAKLNALSGASASTCVSAADALLASCGTDRIPPLGSCSISSTLTTGGTQCLDDFNNSASGNCLTTPAISTTWGRLKTIYR